MRERFFNNAAYLIHKNSFWIVYCTRKKNISVTSEITNDTGHKSKVTIKLDGRTVEFNLAFESDSILEAALKQGADIPYDCKGDVCATWRAKLLQGEITMNVNYALEPGEVTRGFILACQSHSVTESVRIDFDVR